MLKDAFRSLSPLRFERHTAKLARMGASSSSEVAASDQSAREAVMVSVSQIDRALLEAIDEPSIVVEDSIVRLANAPAQKLLGSGVEGRDVRLAIRHPQALERILANVSAEVDATGIAEAGRSWRLIIRSLDRNRSLVRMIDRSDAVSAEKMRVDFVANASHELRTPLSTVIGYAETLADESDLPEDLRSNFGRTIRDEARRMLRIIEDLMSLSRIEADRFVVPGERVDVDDVLETALSNATHVRKCRGSEFIVYMAADLPQVRGDRAQLIQVLDNLISNALRYGCDRPGATIEIAGEQRGLWVHLSVTDHGPGISREHLPRITERFYRVDAARSRESGGTGLGLAIVKHIIERHKGTLDIRSSTGSGTSVSVALPAAT